VDVVASLVGSRIDRQRNLFLGLVFTLGSLFGAPMVGTNLALSAWETDLIQLALGCCALLFFIRGIRGSGAHGQRQVPDPAGGSRRRYLIAGAALAVVTFVTLLVGKTR
jgi:hypothetical protein